MKIAINAGHTIKGKGYGAIGYINESEETRKIVNELLVHFRRKGHDAINCTVDISDNYLHKTVELANKSNADLFISIHFNAGKGKGTEVYTWKGKKLNYAKNICDELHKLGFANRGVKDGSNYYVIKKTKMTSLLIEICFVDNKLDVDLYKELGPKLIALSIYDAIRKEV